MEFLNRPFPSVEWIKPGLCTKNPRHIALDVDQNEWNPPSLSLQVYAKEIVVPRATICNSAPPPKHKTTMVELYFDPRGLVSMVDVLVQEGMRMDYAQPPFSFEENRSPDGGDTCERDQTANKSVKNVIDLPTVPGSTLESENDEQFDSEDVQCDLGSLLIKPSTCDMDVHPAPSITDSCGGTGGVVGHVTSSKLLIGQKMMHSRYQSIVANQILTQFSSWQGFLEFCDNFL